MSALKFGSPNNAYVIHTDPDLFHYDYDVDCNSDGVLEKRHARGDYTCLYRRPGRYRICINGTFPSIRHGSKTDAKKLVSIDQWGTVQWKSMHAAFSECSNMTDAAKDRPDLRHVRDMSEMFQGAVKFNGHIGQWNVSNVTDMRRMFSGVTLSTRNYGRLLIGWSKRTLKRNVSFDGGGSKYRDAGKTARKRIISTFGWTITDGGHKERTCTQSKTLAGSRQQGTQNSARERLCRRKDMTRCYLEIGRNLSSAFGPCMAIARRI